MLKYIKYFVIPFIAILIFITCASKKIGYFNYYKEKESSVYVEIFRDKLGKYYVYPEKETFVQEIPNEDNPSFKGDASLKIDLTRKKYSGVGLLAKGSLDLKPILKYGFLIFAIKGDKGNERVMIGLDDGSDNDGKNICSSVRLSKYIKITKEWQEVAIPLKDFPEYGEYFKEGKTGTDKYDFADFIGIRITTGPSRRKSIPRSIIYLDEIRIKFHDKKIPDGIFTTVLSKKKDILYTYAYPESKSSVNFKNDKIVQMDIHVMDYSGVALGFSIKNILPLRHTGFLEFDYKPVSGKQIFYIALVNSEFKGPKVEARIFITPYLNKKTKDWQTIKIPLEKFSDHGVYYNGKIEIPEKFRWDDVSEIKLLINPSDIPPGSEPQCKFLLKDIKIKKSKGEEHKPIKNLYSTINEIITEDKKKDGVFIGAFCPGVPQNIEIMYEFEKLIGKKVAQIMWYLDWESTFPIKDCNKILEHNAVPHIVWEPWYFKDPDKIKLKDILSGKYDSYIKKWAHGAKDYDDIIFLRWGHEFNGDWYPWSLAQNNMDPALYVSTYRHIHNLFDEVGADNVKWIWCPNNVSVPAVSWNDYIASYPGDKYVDWIGLDGYNFGTTQQTSVWKSFDAIYYNIYRHLIIKGFKKPIMIAEFGCAERGGNKAKWFEELHEILRQKYLRIKSIIFFNIAKEADWRVKSSYETAETIKDMLQHNFYLTSGTRLSKISEKFKSYLPAIKSIEKKEDIISTKKRKLNIALLHNYKTDGILNEWDKIKPLYADDEWYISNKPEWKGEKDLSGKIHIGWDGKKYLLLAAIVKDDFPLNNKYKNGNIWKGDGMEFTIGVASELEPDRVTLRKDDFQFGISCGDGNKMKPFIWIWQKNKEADDYSVIIKKNQDGYVLECKISLLNFNNYIPRENDIIDFNIVLDDLDKGETREKQLIWNGSEEFYSDPSLWGKAVFTGP